MPEFAADLRENPVRRRKSICHIPACRRLSFVSVQNNEKHTFAVRSIANNRIAENQSAIPQNARNTRRTGSKNTIFRVFGVFRGNLVIRISLNVRSAEPRCDFSAKNVDDSVIAGKTAKC